MLMILNNFFRMYTIEMDRCRQRPQLYWLGLRLYVQVNNFSVMSGRSHRFLGITSTLWGGGGGGVNVSCSRIQHCEPSEDPYGTYTDSQVMVIG